MHRRREIVQPGEGEWPQTTRRDKASVGAGLAVSLGSLLLTLLALEAALRLFFPVTDYPVAAYEDGVGMHTAPGQTGTWVVGAGGAVQGDYRINASGWNSLHDYSVEKSDDTLRVAVIGDSFVEVLEVDVERAFPALLERHLASSPACSGYAEIEVYSFGFQGAPMSQYLSVMRHVAGRYDPDVYVISIVHNDFEPSLTSHAPHPHFLSLQPDGNGGFEEIAPLPYQPSALRRVLVKSAIVRFVYGNLKLPDRMPELRTALVQSGEGTGEDSGGAVANGDSEASILVGMVEYLFGEFKAIAQEHDSQLLITLDADRQAIYDGQGPSSEALRYLEIVNHAATRQVVDYIDLSGPFREDYQQVGQPFNSEVDYHWNERGHAVVGEVVADWVEKHACAEFDG